MAKILGPITECQKCGGPVWDNRANKKNPKGPDYKCKDKNCNEAFWFDSAPLAKANAPKQQANGAPKPGGQKWTWQELSTTYERSLKLAEKHMEQLGKRTKIAVTTDNIISAAATIFIAVSRDGVKPLAPQQQPLDERPQQFDEGEDMPF